MDWYKCYPRRLLDACEGLGNVTLVAVYRTIIDRIYETDGAVPNEPASIGKYAGLRPSYAAKAIEELVRLGKLEIDGKNRLMNPRAGDELKRRESVSKARAEAGSKGGKSGSKRSELATNGNEPGVNGNEVATNGNELPSGLAENSQSAQAIASSRAREEIRLKRESPSPPSKRAAPGLDLMPDFDDAPLTPEEARIAAEKLRLVDRIDPPETSELIGDIMREAAMIAPPPDMALVSGWLKLGLTRDEIFKIVVRMTASSRGNIRQMRYFDAEIRREIEARSAASSSLLSRFERIAREHSS